MKCEHGGCNFNLVDSQYLYCKRHGCIFCGATMMESTRNWPIHVCPTCFLNLGVSDLGEIVEAAFMAGKDSGVEGGE